MNAKGHRLSKREKQRIIIMLSLLENKKIKNVRTREKCRERIVQDEKRRDFRCVAKRHRARFDL